MIKVNDLRIGNKLSRTDGSILTVKQIQSKTDDILVEEAEGLFTFGYTATLIPLTEEWLKKFNFRKNISWFVIIRKFNTLEISLNNDTSEIQYYVYFREINDNDFVLLRKDLKYVHQLQNLYYALTGEELIPLTEGQCPQDKGEEK